MKNTGLNTKTVISYLSTSESSRANVIHNAKLLNDMPNSYGMSFSQERAFKSLAERRCSKAHHFDTCAATLRLCFSFKSQILTASKNPDGSIET